jgi:hypothetical protein
MVAPSLRLDVLKKKHHVGGELLGVLKKGEMSDLVLQQQTGIGDLSGYELGILALDRLVVIGIDD